MKFGKSSFFYFLFFFNFFTFLHSEDKIKTIPLVNLENLEASFENEESENQNILEKENLSLKEKKIKETENNSIRINLVALDKITAKTSDINLSIGETKKFGLLEIKALKCGNVKSQSEKEQAAYIQVKDLSNNLTNQVFVFNGWTFSSSTTLNPLDHPVYDLWLVSCENV
jgi:hypothetical protein